ncbi:MAG: VCBS repeat-containing protein [Deltaproteobacteria bacterium]|nr:VCBS repeat-containing protein [Deltaproteobacteria bacterium]
MKIRHCALIFMFVLILPVSTLQAAGTLSFIAAQQFEVGDDPRSVAIGDLDGDGNPDLAAANYHSDNVSVLLNNTAAPSDPPAPVIS